MKTMDSLGELGESHLESANRAPTITSGISSQELARPRGLDFALLHSTDSSFRAKLRAENAELRAEAADQQRLERPPLRSSTAPWSRTERARMQLEDLCSQSLR